MMTTLTFDQIAEMITDEERIVWGGQDDATRVDAFVNAIAYNAAFDAFMRHSGLIINVDTREVRISNTHPEIPLYIVRCVASLIVHELDTEDETLAWNAFNLEADDDVDYNGSYVEMIIKWIARVLYTTDYKRLRAILSTDNDAARMCARIVIDDYLERSFMRGSSST